jgi:hypothetical protein
MVCFADEDRLVGIHQLGIRQDLGAFGCSFQGSALRRGRPLDLHIARQIDALGPRRLPFLYRLGVEPPPVIGTQPGAGARWI